MQHVGHCELIIYVKTVEFYIQHDWMCNVNAHTAIDAFVTNCETEEMIRLGWTKFRMAFPSTNKWRYSLVFDEYFETTRTAICIQFIVFSLYKVYSLAVDILRCRQFDCIRTASSSIKLWVTRLHRRLFFTWDYLHTTKSVGNIQTRHRLYEQWVISNFAASSAFLLYFTP